MGTEIGVVIAQYGRGELTLECIQGIWKHHGGGIHIAIVDDGSHNRFEINRLREFANTTLIALQRNRGVTHAWNTGADHLIQVHAARHIVFLNNDVTTHASWLPQLCKILDGAGGPLIAGHAWREERGLPNELSTLIPDRRLLQGYCLAVSSDTFVSLGGFDPRLRLYFSDTDFQLRAVLRGDPSALQADLNLPIQHLGHQTVVHLPSRRQQWESDRRRFVAKWSHLISVKGGDNAALGPSV